MAYISKNTSKNLKKSQNAYNDAVDKGYKSQYGSQINNVVDQISNRGKFEYDYNTDPQYQALLGHYKRQGKVAMEDAMAQSAALSGGFGNSYAQTVGQQVYNANVNQAADKIPDLYNAALQMYQLEGQDLYNRLGMFQNLDDTAYSRYQDNVGNLYNRMGYYTGVSDNERTFNYNKEQDARNYAFQQQQFNYQKQQDALNYAMQQQQFAYQKAQDERNYKLQKTAKSNSSKSSENKKTLGKNSLSNDSSTGKGSVTDSKQAAINNLKIADYKFKASQYVTQNKLNNGFFNGGTQALNYVNSLYTKGEIDKATLASLQDYVIDTCRKNNVKIDTSALK